MIENKEYTLEDAVKLFYNNENIVEVQCIRNEQDYSDKILELDMGKGDRFLIKFEGFMFLIQDLKAYKANIFVSAKKNKPYSFEFSPSKREYYRFIFKV